jgi:putative hydrolase of the HAD superfamily
MSARIKGILFDMDNTLIDWSGFGDDWVSLERAHLQKVYDFLAEVGRPLEKSFNHLELAYRDNVMDAWAEARTTLRAPHIAKIMMATLKQLGHEPEATLDANVILKAYNWTAAPGVDVFPDVAPSLQQLSAHGVKLGIVTNAFQPMWVRDAELKSYKLLQYFPEETLRISAADVGYLKPHPKIFKHALEQLGTSAEETLYVGDNPVADIAGAQAVGMRAVLRINHPAPPLISGLIIPDAAINSLHELVRLVYEWESNPEKGMIDTKEFKALQAKQAQEASSSDSKDSES